jgi:DNA-binding FadR family transcriptional regulator
MNPNGEKAGLAHAIARLRKHILASETGSFLGNEEVLMGFLGASRGTLRQIARILEREGLLQVRRGIGGGYYAVRPDLGTIEAAVSGYLHSLDVQQDDATMIASVLWVETLRKASLAPREATREIADAFLERLARVKPDATFEEILELELAFREAIFALVDSRYVQLIFQINLAFAYGKLEKRTTGPEPADFVLAWRHAKYMEIVTVADGDQELAAVAAKRARNIWQERAARLP